MNTTVTATDLESTIAQIDFDNGNFKHHGKVRDSFVINKETRAIVVSDRVSAFDFVLGTIPYKGQVLNQLAAWWFAQLDELGVPHHLKAVPHPNVSVVQNVNPLPVEIIVRAYVTGTTTTSSWYAYQHNNRTICDIEMPEGMVKNQILPEPIITPTTKPEIGHDKNVSRAEILEAGWVTEDVYIKIEEYALKMFKHGQKIAADKGLILVDTKYEMGLTDDGALIVIDEVHTPDSSRYWLEDTYAAEFAAGQEPTSLDKEFVRRMVVNAGYDVDDASQNPKDFMTDEIRLSAAQKYLELFERMTGESIEMKGTEGLKAEILKTLKVLA